MGENKAHSILAQLSHHIDEHQSRERSRCYAFPSNERAITRAMTSCLALISSGWLAE